MAAAKHASHTFDTLPPGMARDPLHLLSLGLGSGYAPVAPGTAGTAAALLAYLPLAGLAPPYYLLATALLFAFGVYLCDRTARALQVHDHPGIVFDEWVGYFVTMFLAPSGWGWMLTGFLLFRLFDIAKPWPIRWVDRRVTGGFGIMFDDLLAGIYAWLMMQWLASLLLV